VGSTFKQDDGAVFVESPEAGGCRGTTGYAANDQILHIDGIFTQFAAKVPNRFKAEKLLVENMSYEK